MIETERLNSEKRIVDRGNKDGDRGESKKT